ncbi:MAG TPA: damage-inducible protein, partial [Propioniciclava sp.]|uniref:type ISP restriction/modification enzyme n=1 Tax=Propioniciclava sp. TaxID=2038686 RepID=UPI002C05EAF6
SSKPEGSDLNYTLNSDEPFFPTNHHANLGITVSGGAGFAAVPLMVDSVLDLHMAGDSHIFPRWTYEIAAGSDQAALLDPSGEVDEWGYRRVDNITDNILAIYQDRFGSRVTKDDIFFYAYGVLHSEQYRSMFAADLKRSMPRIPLASAVSDFEVFVDAGRRLADLHVNFETVAPYPLAEQTPFSTDVWQTYRVEKMRWADKTAKKAIIYNQHITLGDIPAEANRYMLGSRSALEWLIDRYQVKTDKDSGIVNDPNKWGREHGDPRYIVDLIKRVTRVSVETMKIVDSLPSLPI